MEQTNELKITILYQADCPNYTKACGIVCDVLAKHEVDGVIDIRKVDHSNSQLYPEFRGSPTVLINGVDVEFCFTDQDLSSIDSEAGSLIACRVYDCDHGIGCPSHEMIDCAVQKTVT